MMDPDNETTVIVRRPHGGARHYSSTDEPNNAQLDGTNEGLPATNEPNPQPRNRLQEIKTGFVERFGTIELENKGSVARDHLALERTFLAWLRTALSFASIGIAITQLFRLNTSLARQSTSAEEEFPVGEVSSRVLSKRDLQMQEEPLHHIGKPLGATFLAIGIVVLLLGFKRYFEAQHLVIQGKFPASRGSVLFITFIAAALLIASLAIILAVNPSSLRSSGLSSFTVP